MPINAVFYLVLAFCNAAGLLFLLEVEFFSILFLLLYVGAIAVLFIFVIIMLDLKNVGSTSVFGFVFYSGLYFPIALILVFSFHSLVLLFCDTNAFVIDAFFIGFKHVSWIYFVDSFSNMHSFGYVLYTFFGFFFLIVGFVLLVSILGSVLLTVEKKNYRFSDGVHLKSQMVFQQISRNAQKAVFSLYQRF